MKKVLATIAGVAVLGLGGVLVLGQQSEEENTESPKVSAETASEEEVKEVVEIPTQRTVEETSPWQTDNNLIRQWHEEGEVVFLLSDAEQVENRMVDVASIDPDAEEFVNAPVDKTTITQTAAETLGLYIEEVSGYVDNDPYFTKLEEVRQAMENENYGVVSSLIEEAKTLRESE